MLLASFVNQFILLGSQRPFRTSIGSYGDNPSRTNPDAVTITQTETSRDFACTAEPLAIATPDISSATAFAIIYGFPLLPYAQWIKPLIATTGSNVLKSEPGLANPDSKLVVRPNADTVYSQAAVDLSHTDLELEVPLVPDGRFYTFAFYDLYGNNFATVGTLNQSQPGTYLIKLRENRPSKSAQLGFQYQDVIEFPTVYGGIVVRILVYNNGSDLENVHAIQNKIAITPVSRTQPAEAPYLSVDLLTTSLDDNAALTWPGSFNDTATIQLLNLTARLYPYGPPENVTDTARVKNYFKAAGLIDGVYTPPPEGVNFTASNIIVNSSLDALINSNSSYIELGNSWRATAPALSGDYQSNYVARTHVAWWAYLLLKASIAIYPDYSGSGDSSNTLYVANDSALIFTFSGKPPVDGFWSLTAYGIDDFFIPNKVGGAGVYSLGDRSNLLYINGTRVYDSASTDDTFQILMQPADLPPPQNWTSNWLPAPSGGGPFSVSLRYYGPTNAITTGSYEQPSVTPIRAIIV